MKQTRPSRGRSRFAPSTPGAKRSSPPLRRAPASGERGMRRRPGGGERERERAQGSGIPPQELARYVEQSARDLALLHKQSEALQAKTRPKNADELRLDSWQEEAIAYLSQGTNVVIDAPTTAGKTRVVESFFAQHIDDATFRACYTCPVKSLSNDKFKEFRQQFGLNKVGISTGDYRENLSAPLVVATLETYRNSLLGVEPDFGRRLVVFDEYHFLQDASRGSSWEEAIILTPPDCQMLLLSASIGNARDFVRWIEEITKRPTILITVSDRPVPLVNLVWEGNSWLMADLLPKPQVNLRRSGHPPAVGGDELTERVAALIPQGLTPCLVYAGKRRSCENIAEALVAALPPLSSERRRHLQLLVTELDRELKALELSNPELTGMIFSHGIAYHHSGLMPPVRLLIERLLKEGELAVCVATMGLSLGINFAVKSTVISDFVRPGEFGFVSYGTSEVLQMTGRAGRRGRDVVGFSCWLNLAAYRKLLPRERENCYSNLRNDPSTILGLYSRGFRVQQIEHFYHQSFLKFIKPGVHLSLIYLAWLKKQLGPNAKPPCQSPGHEFAKYYAEENASCYDCPLIKNCHQVIRKKEKESSLAAMHLHLHRIGALTGEEQLSERGDWARFFPQNGGILVAIMLAQGEISSETLQSSLELMAALSLAHFKTSKSANIIYKFPYSVSRVRRDLEVLYPRELFPDYYEQPKGFRKEVYIFKDFNPAAGFVIKLWCEGLRWDELLKKTTLLDLGEGDISGLIYRCASYLQSLAQAQKGDISQAARELRKHILREPVLPTF